MRVPFADLRAQYYELKEQIDAAMVRVIESGRFIGGEDVTILENTIAQTCGAEYGIGVASGTDALVLSLVACGIGNGDEVITTPFTFGATSEAIALVGAKPVYVDIDPCTYNMDVSQIEARITSKTRALLPVDLYGQMADRATLACISQEYNLRLIVDSAQAIGSKQFGNPIALHGHTTTLSFYPTKNLGAYGDAGMVLTNDPEINENLRSLRGHGTKRHKYIHERIGYCSRLDTMQAAFLRVKIAALEDWNNIRRRNASIYNEMLAEIEDNDCNGISLPGVEPGNHHIYHQYTLRHTHRDELKEYLRQNDVDSEIYYPYCLHLQPAYAYLGYTEGDFPVAERVAKEVLSLPIHPELTEEQIRYVANLVCQFH